MAKGEFDMLYLCARGGGAMIFSFDKSTSLEGGSEKKPWDDQGGFKKMKGKNKEIIIAHPLDKLWMLPNELRQEPMIMRCWGELNSLRTPSVGKVSTY